MVIFPKAKINLGLLISGRRCDGYHDIETVFYPLPLSDALEMVPKVKGIKKDILTLTGMRLQGKKGENLVLRAVKKLRETFPVPYLKIHLHKAIPSGAGLGGGSSDAGFVLSAINRLFGFACSRDELMRMAGELGSDCPFFIECKPSLATGRGELIKPVENVLDGYTLLLINPGINISTKEAYENCKPGKPGISPGKVITMPVPEWKELLVNDFERTVFRKHPVIASFKDKLYQAGAVYSSMSGSGSSVYGIFTGEPVVPDEMKKFVIYQGSF